MKRTKLALALMSGAALTSLLPASAATFNIPGGTLATALEAYSQQSGAPVAIATQSLSGAHSSGAVGEMSADQALVKILSGTGFEVRRVGSTVAIVRARSLHSENQIESVEDVQLAQATPPRAAVETVTVTSSKLGGADVQSIPISITALSQEQLTATQTAGGPDLIKQVPNMTFTKTNFSGYSIQLRGIGTQAISVTTDPAVAVAFNDQPFIRNHFFEQEFYDLSQVEVLRGPQGTLYGRNATAGVVNLTSAKPTDQFEAMASADIGNYHQRRFEGMINVPIVDDRLDIRVAGEWTKRQGYSFNSLTDSRIDGRDLWSGRTTIGVKPVEDLQIYLIWEHFSENDDRLRSSKQLCKTAPTPTSIDGVSTGATASGAAYFLSQGCLSVSLYSPEAFEVPNGFSLPYYGGITGAGVAAGAVIPMTPNLDPYLSTTQSTNLRVIESTLNPTYKVKNDTVELNSDYAITPALTFVSQTAFNHDFLWSTEDYNRFNTAPGIFDANAGGNDRNQVSPEGVFCDPQLGCSNRLVAEDLNDLHAWQLGQEFRLTSNFSGPFNFSVGSNYLHYETEENYYVFINTLTLFVISGAGGQPTSGQQFGSWIPGVSDEHECLDGFVYSDPAKGSDALGCRYVDPNPINHLNNQGHNYFLNQNPYVLNSYASFGELNYEVAKDLKLTAGLRWTEDQKHFTDIPSELVVLGWG